MSLTEALRCCDIVVECAGQQALVDHGVQIVSSGRHLVVTSVGALVAPAVRRGLDAGPGRWVVTSGAIGGVDILSAASRQGQFDSVTLTTTKLPSALRQTWMSAREVSELMDCSEQMEIFRGTVQEAARRFPASMNVAATVAMASRCDDVQVRICADPQAERTRHKIRARHPLGRFDIEVGNLPSLSRPSTSAVVAYGVLRTLQNLVDPTGEVI